MAEDAVEEAVEEAVDDAVEGVVSENRDVVLGFDAAWGFAPADHLSLVISLVPEISPVLEVVEYLLLLGSMAGGKAWTAPLTAMVAERSGRSWRMTLRMARPVRSWAARATARAVDTMVRCASIASRLRANMGRAARSVLLILKDCSTCQRSW